MNLNVSCELLVVVMCQCRSIICNKCTSLVWTLTVREVMCGGGQGLHGISLYFPLNFAMNLKFLLKNKVF